MKSEPLTICLGCRNTKGTFGNGERGIMWDSSLRISVDEWILIFPRPLICQKIGQTPISIRVSPSISMLPNMDHGGILQFSLASRNPPCYQTCPKILTSNISHLFQLLLSWLRTCSIYRYMSSSPNRNNKSHSGLRNRNSKEPKKRVWECYAFYFYLHAAWQVYFSGLFDIFCCMEYSATQTLVHKTMFVTS